MTRQLIIDTVLCCLMLALLLYITVGGMESDRADMRLENEMGIQP